MREITVPNKIAWYVDLVNPKPEVFLDEIQQKLSSEKYTSQVRFEVMDNSSILKIFFPLYIKTVMNRSDFRLDKGATEKKIISLANNPEYELLWFTFGEGKMALGGVVIHHLREEVRVAYRCFDHVQAKLLGLAKIDYFAESKMQNYLRTMNYKKLCHGNDHHPVDQIGLSIYKLRVGARPAVSYTAKNILIEENSLREIARNSGSAGYYKEPSNGYYQEFILYGSPSDTVNIFIKAATKMNVKVIMI